MKDARARPHASTLLNCSRGVGRKLDVPVDKLNKCLRVGFAMSATGQTFGEVNRALPTQAPAARLAISDGLSVIVIKATHKCKVRTGSGGFPLSFSAGTVAN